MMTVVGKAWRRTASAGWLLIGVSILIVSVWVVVRAVGARSSDVLGVWAGWANVLALPVAAIGTAVVLFDRALARRVPTERVAEPEAPSPTPSPTPWMSRVPEGVLVDRSELMSRLRAELLAPDDGAIAVTGVHGAGGFGKTTLVAQASAIPELHERFPGGLLWVTIGPSMRGPELAQAVNDVTEHLTGIRPAFTTAEQAGYRLGVELDRRPPVLLILDDVWTGEQLRPFVMGGPRCKRLVTTRVARLLSSATLIEVDEMSRIEAAALLNHDVTGLPAPSTTVLLELTGRWPLLVALVNGALRRRIRRGEDVLAAAATVVAQLSGDGPTVLDVTVVDQRERAVDLTVRASLDVLPKPDRQRFRELGVFPENVVVPDTITDLLWSRTGACGAGQTEGLRNSLADLALVQRRTDGVVVHDVLRSYLRHGLAPDGLHVVNAALVGAARELVPSEAWAAPFPWWRLPDDADYLWRHLCYHLDEGGSAAELRATATHLEFVAAKVERLGVAAVEADLDRVPGEYGEALRMRLSTNAHLLAPLEPPGAFRDLLVSRLSGVPLLDRAVRDFAAVTSDRSRLVLKWPLPDLGPASLTRVIVGGLGWLSSCAVAPTGRWLAAGSHTGVIGIWDRTTGLPLGRLLGHAGEVNALAITSDSAWIVSGGSDGTLRVWDAARRRPVHRLALHDEEVTACAVSPDSMLAASTAADRTLQVVDIVTGKTVFTYRTGDESLDCCCFLSPSEVICASRFGEVTLHDLRAGTTTALLTAGAVVVQAMAVAADRSWLALTGDDEQIRLLAFDPTTGEPGEPVDLVGHDGFVTALAADGDRLVSGGSDGTIRIWDTGTHRAVATVQAHTSWVNECVLTSDRKSLISAGTDGMLRVWEMSQLSREVVTGHIDWVNTLAVAPDGEVVVSGGNDDTVRFWAAEDARPTAPVWRSPTAVWSCAFGPRRDLVAVVTVTRTYLLRRARSGWEAVELGGSDAGAAPHRCAVSPGGRLVAVGGLNGGVTVRPVDGPDDLAHHDQAGAINAVRFLDDDTLVFGGSDGQLRVWRFRSGPPTVGAEGMVSIQAFTLFAGGSLLICFTSRGARLFDASTLRPVATARLPAGNINDGAVSYNDRWLATVGDDGELRVFALDALSFAPVASMRVDGALFACQWRPGSHELFAAGRRGVYAFAFDPGSRGWSAAPSEAATAAPRGSVRRRPRGSSR